jgi:hypothetical protein
MIEYDRFGFLAWGGRKECCMRSQRGEIKDEWQTVVLHGRFHTLILFLSNYVDTLLY